MKPSGWVDGEYVPEADQYSKKVTQRPILQLNLKFGGKITQPSIGALVDSGAEDTLFDSVIAEQLGVGLAKKTKFKNLGGLGGTIRGYPATLELQVVGTEEFMPFDVFFVDNLPIALGILGERFFEEFNVRFYRNELAFCVRRVPKLKK